MRRTHLRGHDNILKRQLVHVAAFNLGLLLRTVVGAGTPRGLAALWARSGAPLRALIRLLRRLWRSWKLASAGSPGGAAACAA